MVSMDYIYRFVFFFYKGSHQSVYTRYQISSSAFIKQFYSIHRLCKQAKNLPASKSWVSGFDPSEHQVLCPWKHFILVYKTKTLLKKIRPSPWQLVCHWYSLNLQLLVYETFHEVCDLYLKVTARMGKVQQIHGIKAPILISRKKRVPLKTVFGLYAALQTTLLSHEEFQWNRDSDSRSPYVLDITTTCLFKYILKISPPKTESFQIKNRIFFI